MSKVHHDTHSHSYNEFQPVVHQFSHRHTEGK